MWDGQIAGTFLWHKEKLRGPNAGPWGTPALISTENVHHLRYWLVN